MVLSGGACGGASSRRSRSHSAQRHGCVRIVLFVMSVLSYIGQFLPPPQNMLDTERKHIRKFAKGPGNWIAHNELCNLRGLCYLPTEFKDLA